MIRLCVDSKFPKFTVTTLCFGLISRKSFSRSASERNVPPCLGNCLKGTAGAPGSHQSVPPTTHNIRYDVNVMSSGVSRESLCLKNFLNVQANPLAWCATSQVSPSYRSRKPQAPASQRCTYGVWAPAGMRIRRSSTSSDLQAANGTFTDKWPIGLIKSLARAVSTDPREIETILFDIEKYGQLRKGATLSLRSLYRD